MQLPLDDAIIEKMTGFDFGPADFISRELTKIIESEDYQAVLRSYSRESSANPATGEKKRGVFDFYKRRSSTTSRDTLINASAEAIQAGSDPVNAFSPLLSIYFLVREKQERERIEANPGALSIPMSPGEEPLKMPDLPAPEAAYTNSSTYEMSGEKATGGRSRPRARTQGEDEVTQGMKKASLSVPVSPAIVTTLPPPQQPSSKKESTAAGLLRRFSTRRNKEPTRERNDSHQSPSTQLQPPNDAAAPIRASFSVRRSRNRDPRLSPSATSADGQAPQPELLAPNPGASVQRPGSKGLGRSTSVNSAEYRRRPSRRDVSETLPSTPIGDAPHTSGSDRSSMIGQKVRINEPESSEQKVVPNARAATARTKSLGHARRDSVHLRRARREEARQSGVPEETDAELERAEDSVDRSEGLDQTKPVYLKGLFSVSTTSNKPLPYIRADIVRVLKQLGVTYTEIKGGFACRHAPSIDLNRVTESGPSSSDRQGFVSNNHRRRISFGGIMGGDRDREELREHEKPPQFNRSRNHSRRRAPDMSFTNSEDSEEDLRRRNNDRVAGETSTHVENDLGDSLVLKFEIFVVKVPLFSLHGIQFKKVSGGTWQYKNMAQKILDALRL